MKVLVTGVAGQLGHDVMNELAKRDYNGIGSDITPEYSGLEDGTAVVDMPYVPLDITDKAQVKKTIIDICPDVVVHCAAWTAVDTAEEPDNRERVFSVNADGTRNIAEACKDTDAKMIYISTDYVFDGSGTEPWKPDSQNYNPINIYGESKLRGELAVRDILEKYYIVRIAWVFGVQGGNFVKTMLKLGKKFDNIRVVNDQIGTPTYTYDLARLLVDMAETDKYGCYHATNEGGYISWYDFACEIFKLAGYNTNIEPVSTEEYGISKAARPFNSRLDKSKLTENGFRTLPIWENALLRYLKELKEITG